MIMQDMNPLGWKSWTPHLPSPVTGAKVMLLYQLLLLTWAISSHKSISQFSYYMNSNNVIQLTDWIFVLPSFTTVKSILMNFFSEVAVFLLHGRVNSQNTTHWSSWNLRSIRENPMHRHKIGACCSVSTKRIVGPLFFEVLQQCVQLL